MRRGECPTVDCKSFTIAAQHTITFILYPPAMRSISLLFTTLAIAAGTFAEPVVQSITPKRGPDSGGTEVTIRGSGLATRINCLLPCPPIVSFGKTEVDAVEISDQELRVTTPAHAAGVVDVTVSIPAEPPVVVLNGFTFIDAAEAQYVRVLLPVWLKDTVPGAQGTRWRTDFWLRNNGRDGARIAAWNCPAGHACPPVFPLTYNLLPDHSLHNSPDFSTEPRNNPSQLLYVANEDAADVAMSLRVADISRGSLNAGTDVPVIREDELLAGTAHLFEVPIGDKAFRVLLRVYELTHTSSAFLVRLYAQSEDPSPVIGTYLVTAVTPQSGLFRTEAAYGQLQLSDLVDTGTLSSGVRVEIEPLTAGSRYWAFASLTNNETQLITLVTPQ